MPERIMSSSAKIHVRYLKRLFPRAPIAAGVGRDGDLDPAAAVMRSFRQVTGDPAGQFP
jgi:hypothetical protein